LCAIIETKINILGNKSVDVIVKRFKRIIMSSRIAKYALNKEEKDTYKKNKMSF